MKIKPKMDYELSGTEIKMNKNKIYNAVPATNQPEWKKKGKIFAEVHGYPYGIGHFLLEKGEYTIIRKKLRRVI